MLSYLIVGLDSSAIAFLCNVSRENARVKKTRIKGIVLNAETPNHDLYYTFFEVSKRLSLEKKRYNAANKGVTA